MNLAHLTYFKKLAETKMYRDAARECNVSQSTLSNAITNLEKELGATLFVRKKGLVELTEQGNTFYQYVDTSLRFLKNGVDVVKEQSGKQIREITIGTIMSAQSTDWSEIIYQFRRQVKGNIQINVIQSTTPDILSQLKKGKLDVAFCGSMGPDPALVQYPFWTQDAVLVINRAHPLASRESISLQELAQHYLISYTLDGPVGQALVDLVNDYDLSIDCLYEDEITLAAIVAANPDIIAIACDSWLLSSYSHEVVRVPIQEAQHNFRQIYFSYLAHSEKPQVVETFIELATSSRQ